MVLLKGSTGWQFLISEVPLYCKIVSPPRSGKLLHSREKPCRAKCYGVASLVRKRFNLGPYSRAMSRAIWWF